MHSRKTFGIGEDMSTNPLPLPSEDDLEDICELMLLLSDIAARSGLLDDPEVQK